MEITLDELIVTAKDRWNLNIRANEDGTIYVDDKEVFNANFIDDITDNGENILVTSKKLLVNGFWLDKDGYAENTLGEFSNRLKSIYLGE